MRLYHALILSALASSVSFARNLPVAYDIVDLGGLERVTNENDLTTAFSFAGAINNNGQAVGTSEGKHTVINSVDDFGIANQTIDINILKPIDFSDANRSVMPTERDFGFGIQNTGMFVNAINSSGLIFGYGFQTEQVQLYTKNESGVCVASVVSNEEREQGFVFDLNNNLTIITSSVNDNLPIDPNITEYTNSRVFSANEDFAVGYANIVLEKDECNNISLSANRGFVYDLNTNSIVKWITPLDQSDQESPAFSRVQGINAAGQFVGLTHQLEDDQRKVVGFIGNVNSEQLTEVPSLSGATSARLNAITDDGAFAVGGSNSSSQLNANQAFYYSNETQTSHLIGYLNAQFKSSEAFDINKDYLVVGTSLVSSSPRFHHPFIYDIEAENASIIDLNSMIDCDAGWSLSEVRAINDDGEIVGSGSVLVAQEDGVVRGEVHAFKLKPRVRPANQNCSESTDDSGSFSWLLSLLLVLLGIRKIRT